VNERPVITAPPAPELLSELRRLELENSHLRSMLEGVALGEMDAPLLSPPRWRWWLGRTIAMGLFATGVALATLMVAGSRPVRQVRSAVRAAIREGRGVRIRDTRVVLPALPPVPPMPPAPPAPAAPPVPSLPPAR
jgi:hypothetical protein